ncbi:MAG: hypothetical protein WC655_01405 [Candidatus Hydrogenedentales bacterium]|jgi:L-ascorbate metabolism protein UlaG (beta-lactamase superfamily)
MGKSFCARVSILVGLGLVQLIATGGHTQAAPSHFSAEEFATALAGVSDVLAHPPSAPEAPERRIALEEIDRLTRDPEAENRPALQDFLRGRLQQAVEEMEQTKVTDGARIWKLYNHTFIVRTKSVTLAFDLTNWLGNKLRMDARLLERIVSQCDVLFISHPHVDHTHEDVAQIFVNQGKPVIAPPNIDFPASLTKSFLILERDPDKEQTVSLNAKGARLRIVIYPGHQERMDFENNVVLVMTPEKLSFAHTGDQYNMGSDFKWIDTIGKRHKVDVLMVNAWTFGFQRVVDGFNPRLVLTGHENEVGHPVQLRETYEKSYDKLSKGSTPGLVMTWGEAYTYKR